MTLIKSISGIRGTIGGSIGEALTPIDIVECAAAFGTWTIQKTGIKRIVIGRDARISGEMVHQLVSQTLVGLGFEVIDLGLSTTPTVEHMVPIEQAGAGIVLTASHNPAEWNALKFLNDKGEFISARDGEEVLELITKRAINFADVHSLGYIRTIDDAIEQHIEAVLTLPHVNPTAIRNSNFKVVLDCINSTGVLSILPLLEQLNCQVVCLNSEPNGHFAHNPEPLEQNLVQLSETILEEKADMGIAVDPDVDRLVFLNEDGSMFGEEYTLVAVAAYVLSKEKGNTVSNLSSTRALRDVTAAFGGQYTAAAVGEVNVVTAMKETKAVIGGEGNGGIIYPAAHYGRDALVGVALFLSLLAEKNCKMTALKASYPAYYMSKNKVNLNGDSKPDAILEKVASHYEDLQPSLIDGVKIDFEDGWVHLRKSNTEPIIRIYTEGTSTEKAEALARDAQKVIDSFM